MLTIIFLTLCVLLFFTVLASLIAFIVMAIRDKSLVFFAVIFSWALLVWLIFGCYTLAIYFPHLQ